MYANKMVKILIDIGFGITLQPKKDMCMRKTPLLMFSTVEPGLQTTKATIFQNLHKVLNFQTKNSHQ